MKSVATTAHDTRVPPLNIHPQNIAVQQLIALSWEQIAPTNPQYPVVDLLYVLDLGWYKLQHSNAQYMGIDYLALASLLSIMEFCEQQPYA